MSRKLLTTLLAATLLGAVLVGHALANNGAKNNKTFEYTVGLWGDMPYSNVQATMGIPNLIADMNNSDISFSVHDGDLKQGNGAPTCSDDLYTDALGMFNSLTKPAMFTPGDNDWVDCNRPNNGPYPNTLERLDYERQVFFSTDYSMGQHPMLQEVQSTASCLGWDEDTEDLVAAPCVENRIWTYKGVTYATLNIQGSCNNLCPKDTVAVTYDNEAEWEARNQANIEWLHHAFDVAEANGSSGVMLISQADPGFDRNFGESGVSEVARDPQSLLADDIPDGFYDFLLALRDETIDFGKPVAYVHGDTHYFRVDKPLLDADGYRIENFTRVETFGDNADTTSNGSNDVHWLKVLVDSHSRDVFAFQPQIVPANVATYTK